MSLYLDLETDRWRDDEEARERVEWVTIRLDYNHVLFHSEHTVLDGSRRVDPEAGISFHRKHLNAVIDALIRLRSELPSDDRSK